LTAPAAKILLKTLLFNLSRHSCRPLGEMRKEDFGMTRHNESVSATLHEGRLVQIHVTRLERGVDVGGKLWLSLDAAPWLIEAVSKCIEDLTSSETTIGPDSLRVKEKGH
jgi:hypothetical protein